MGPSNAALSPLRLIDMGCICGVIGSIITSIIAYKKGQRIIWSSLVGFVYLGFVYGILLFLAILVLLISWAAIF